MPPDDILIPTDVLDFPKGLSLIQVFAVAVNDPPKPITGPLVYKATAKVPVNTRFVDVSCVAESVDVPSEGDDPVGIKAMSSEIFKQPMSPGSSLFSFTFTVDPAWTENLPWKGRFKLEFKCYGSPG